MSDCRKYHKLNEPFTDSKGRTVKAVLDTEEGIPSCTRCCFYDDTVKVNIDCINNSCVLYETADYLIKNHRLMFVIVDDVKTP